MGRATRINKITTPELLTNINPENKRLKDDYLSYLKSIQRSESTIAVYSNDIDICFVWCLERINNKFFVDWTKRDIISLQNWLINENGNNSARVRRIKATLSSMSNYIENVLDDEFPKFRNIIHRIESPVSEPARQKTVLYFDDVQKLLDHLVEHEDYEKACFIALAAFSGRRKSELLRFKVSYFDKDNLICDGALYRTPEKIKTKGRGKGKMLHCYTLAKKFEPYLELWLEYRKKKNIESEWLFPHHVDPTKQLTVAVVNAWMGKFSKIMDLPIYTHLFRSTFTTELVKAGLPDSVIQSIIGWESADMCRLYCQLSAEDQFAMYFKDGGIAIPEKRGIDAI